MSHIVKKRTLELMVVMQFNTCPICLRRLEFRAVDHCHKTGRVRGVLCRTCNSGIGMLRDDVGNFRRAAEYVQLRFDAAAVTDDIDNPWERFLDFAVELSPVTDELDAEALLEDFQLIAS
jgi:hypothetical protein